MTEAVVDSRWTAASRVVSSSAVAPGVAAAIVLPAALAAIDNLPVGVVHDDGMYTILAKSLATGQGFRWLNIPGAPPATHFPPGYPAVLSLVWRLFPDFPANVFVFKTLNALLLAVTAALVVVFARKRLGLSSRAACIAAVAGCLAVPTLVLSTLVMSETLFFALLMPALLVADELLDEQRRDGRTLTPARAALLGAIGGALMLVRTHGAAFVVAVLLVLLRRRQRRASAIVLAVAGGVVAPWLLWQSMHASALPAVIRGDYGPYGAWLVDGARGDVIGFVRRTISATSRELFATLAALSAAGLPWVWLRVAAVTGALAALGAGIARFRRVAPVAGLFTLCYVGIILLWPFTPARFLWAIWPLLVLLFAAGAQQLAGWRPRVTWTRAARYLIASGLLLAVFGQATYTVRGYRGRWWSSIPRSATTVAAAGVMQLSRTTGRDDVIASNAEPMVYLYTGRTSVPATRLSPSDYFAPPSARSREVALAAILDAFHPATLAVIANDSLEAAARRLTAGTAPRLVARDSVPYTLIFSSSAR